MSLVPGLGIAKGMAPDPAPLLRAQGHDHVPRGAADVAAQVPRPAAAALRRVGHAQVRDLLPVRPGLPDRVHRHGRHRHARPLSTSTGARPRRTASGARSRRCGAPAGPSRTRPTGRSRAVDLAAVDAILEELRPRPGARCSQILEATQAAYGYLPVAALKRISQRTGAWYAMIYGTATLLRPPALRAADGDRAGRRGRRAPARRGDLPRRPSTRALERRAAGAGGGRRGGLTDGDDLLQDARPAGRRSCLERAGADGPDRPRRAPSRAGAFDGLRRAIRDLGRDRRRSRRSRASGLRGRGGAGFPTGDKWRDRGRDRGAAPLRRGQRLRRGPGVAAPTGPCSSATRTRSSRASAIAAFAIGATRGDHRRPGRGRPRRSARLEAAIGAAEEAGFLGSDVLGSGHDIAITVRPVQGAYMLGEETVLLKALEGKRGQPEQRPPHPAERGLFDMPTVVHNVQTLAAVPVDHPQRRRRRSPRSARRTSPGTILVQVRDAGRRRHRRGPARDAAARRRRARRRAAGAAARSRRSSSAARRAACCRPTLLDTPYDFEPLRAAGAHVGSGSVVVADDRACIVDLARLLTRFCADEACGKTIPCRIGTRRLVEIADRVVDGPPAPDRRRRSLADLSADIVASALCDHERLTTLPLTSGMRYFRSELDEHILRSACPAGVCHPIAVAAGAIP